MLVFWREQSPRDINQIVSDDVRSIALPYFGRVQYPMAKGIAVSEKDFNDKRLVYTAW